MILFQRLGLLCKVRMEKKPPSQLPLVSGLKKSGFSAPRRLGSGIPLPGGRSVHTPYFLWSYSDTPRLPPRIASQPEPQNSSTATPKSGARPWTAQQTPPVLGGTEGSQQPSPSTAPGTIRSGLTGTGGSLNLLYSGLGLQDKEGTSRLEVKEVLQGIRGSIR